MADIRIVKAHGFQRDEARTRVTQMLEAFRQEQPKIISKVEFQPDGYSARIEGTGFKGLAVIGDHEVTVEVSLGLLVKPLKGKAEDTLRRKLDKALDTP